MKFFLFILASLTLLLATPQQADAQVRWKSTYLQMVSDSNSTVRDTTANATTDSKILAVPGSGQSLSIQFVYTRLSGTAGGTIYLSQSNNGTNWKPITGDSITVANAASGSYFYEKTNFKPRYLKLTYVGTGTMSVAWTGDVFYRREE